MGGSTQVSQVADVDYGRGLLGGCSRVSMSQAAEVEYGRGLLGATNVRVRQPGGLGAAGVGGRRGELDAGG